MVKPRQRFIPDGVDLVYGEVDRVEPDRNEVLLADGRRLTYGYLVVATGVEPRPDQTPGMLDGGQWRKSIFDFYTYDGAVALADALREFPGGWLVVHIVDMPIKCPVAPLEFTFLSASGADGPRPGSGIGYAACPVASVRGRACGIRATGFTARAG